MIRDKEEMTEESRKESRLPYKSSDIRRMALVRKARRERDAERKKNRELELRVKQSTRELRFANEKLQAEIAERKRAEEELRESETKYRALFENVHDELGIGAGTIRNRNIHVHPGHRLSAERR